MAELATEDAFSTASSSSEEDDEEEPQLKYARSIILDRIFLSDITRYKVNGNPKPDTKSMVALRNTEYRNTF